MALQELLTRAKETGQNTPQLFRQAGHSAISGAGEAYSTALSTTSSIKTAVTDRLPSRVETGQHHPWMILGGLGALAASGMAAFGIYRRNRNQPAERTEGQVYPSDSTAKVSQLSEPHLERATSLPPLPAEVSAGDESRPPVGDRAEGVMDGLAPTAGAAPGHPGHQQPAS